MIKKHFKRLILLLVLLLTFTTIKVKAANINLVMVEQAAIRTKTTKTSQGLRFFSLLDRSYENYEHGFYLIYGETSLNELKTAINSNNLIINDKEVFKVPVSGIDNNNKFSIVLTGIPEVGYLDLITVISYLNYNNQTYYSNANTRSIGEVAIRLTEKNVFIKEVLDVLSNKYRAGLNQDDEFIITKGIYEDNYLLVKDKLIDEWNIYFNSGGSVQINSVIANLEQFLINNKKWSWLIDYFSYLCDEDLIEGEQLAYSFYNFLNGTNLAGSIPAANFTLQSSYQEMINFNNKIVVDKNYSFYNIDDQVALPNIKIKDDKLLINYKLNNTLYDINSLVTVSSQTKVFKPVWSSKSIWTIRDFIDSPFNYYDIYISGVVTSLGNYNSFSIDDGTAAIAVRIPYSNVNEFSDLGYKVGDEVIVYGSYSSHEGLEQANTSYYDIEKISENNTLDVVDLNNSPLDNLSLYQHMSKLITLDNLIINSIYEDQYRFTFMLLTLDNNLLRFTVDKRLDDFDYDYIYTFNQGDEVNLDKALLSWFNEPQLTIDNKSQIVKVGETITDPGVTKEYKIFYLNDTHGAILYDDSGDETELGLARIGNYINNKKDENSIFITGGDMFQGQFISNQNKGALMIEIFNELNLDAFVIGNHEFDWGLEEILKYFDPNYEGVKANFPLLGANVILKATGQRPEFIDTHVIIERGDEKIGIIGVIGDGLESSISYPRVKDYKFTSAYQAVADTVDQIKDEVDFIIVANHHNSSNFNYRVATLPKVAAIFNGHSHSETIDYIDWLIPVVQSRHNGVMVGEVDLTFEKVGSTFNFISSYARNVMYNTYLNTPDLAVQNIIDTYYEDMYPFYENVILTASRSMSQDDLAYFIARLMKEVTNSVAGFQNTGGTRSTLSYNQGITAADVFQITPFDNQIVVVEISGYNLKNMLNNSYFYRWSDLEVYEIVDYQMYQIATNDYIYYSNLNENIFGNTYGSEVLFGDVYETFYQVLLNLKDQGYYFFDTTSPIYYDTPLTNIYSEIKYYAILEDRKQIYLN